MMMNIAIIGASGAIGRAFVKHFSTFDHVRCIYAFSRSGCLFEAPKVVSGHINLTDENSIMAAAQTAGRNSLLDLIIVSTGILSEDEIKPEKSLRDISTGNFEKLFAVNTIGPALVMKYFLPLLQKNTRSVFAAISARLGSISDNHLGGWYSYRASKAALNMLIKNASIEMSRRSGHSIVVGLHPGTVDSNLSKNFQKNVMPDKLFTPDYTVDMMTDVLGALTPQDTGKCFAYDGKEIQP
jgi:NAD(P)-dependent dehydrogenase (short-subunit alcohol dehydrogenase family)